MGSVDRDIRLIKNGEEIEHEKNIFYYINYHFFTCVCAI